LSCKPNRLVLNRRRIIAAAAGLAAGLSGSNRGHAQSADDGLPPAALGLGPMAPVPAPRLRFTDAAGAKLSLADYAGHGLVVNLWATWCGPCVAEIPSLSAVAPVLRRSGVLVLPIAIDLSGAAVVKPFYDRHRITGLPILLDTSGAVMDVLHTTGIPLTIIVNGGGQIVGRVEGAANWDTPQTVSAILALTGQTMVAPAAPQMAMPRVVL
jgi:thiol-disulfide isomerase/thioredoxin